MKCKCEVKNMIKITKELWHCPVCQSDWQRTKTGIRKLEKKKFITASWKINQNFKGEK